MYGCLLVSVLCFSMTAIECRSSRRRLAFGGETGVSRIMTEAVTPMKKDHVTSPVPDVAQLIYKTFFNDRLAYVSDTHVPSMETYDG